MSDPHERAGRTSWVVGAWLALTVVALWIPEGFVDGIYEEWLFLDQYLAGMSALEVGGHFLRPLVLVPFYWGFYLTPGSFVGLNVVLMIVIWARGMFLFLVLRELGARPSLAGGIALLFLLYPADDGQMSTRTVGIQASAALLLLSTALLLRLGRRFRPGLAVATAAILAVTVLGYEAPYAPAMFCPLLLLWTVHPRRAWPAAATWYAVLIPLAVRYVVGLFGRPGSYQGSLLAIEASGRSLLETAGFLAEVYRRVLLTSWVDASFDLAHARWSDLILGAVVAVSAGAVLLLLHRWSPVPGPGDDERRFVVVLGAIGLIAVGVGFAMYLPSNAREATWRTLFLPSIGGAIVVGVLVWAAARARARSFVPAIAVLALVACVHLVDQHRSYAAIARNQDQILRGIGKAAPALDPRTRLLLVLDRTDTLLSHEFFPSSRYLRAALAHRYDVEDLNAHVCYPFSERRGETCVFGADGVTVEHQDVGWRRGRLGWEVPYDAVVAVEVDRREQVRLLEALPPWYTLQEGDLDYRGPSLVEPGRDEGVIRDTVRLEFEPHDGVGAGWGPAQTNPAGVTYRFMTNDRAAIPMRLRPGPHQIEIRIANGIDPALLATLGLTVGGRPIELERIDGALFRGEIEPDLIADDGPTTLVLRQDHTLLAKFQAERGPHIGLGVDWVEVTRAPSTLMPDGERSPAGR